MTTYKKQEESWSEDSPSDKSQVRSRRRKCHHYCISLFGKINSKLHVDLTIDKTPIHPPSSVRRVERRSRWLQSFVETQVLASS